MRLEGVAGRYCVARYDRPPALPGGLVFYAATDREHSLICEQSRLPPGATHVEDGFCAMRVEGRLDMAMVGVLAALTGALAGGGVPVMALSTYDTDYLLVREAMRDRARALLAAAGHEILSARGQE